MDSMLMLTNSHNTIASCLWNSAMLVDMGMMLRISLLAVVMALVFIL
jgi:hypothetical protein